LCSVNNRAEAQSENWVFSIAQNEVHGNAMFFASNLLSTSQAGRRRVRVASCYVRDELTSEPTIWRTRVRRFAHTLLTRSEFHVDVIAETIGAPPNTAVLAVNGEAAPLRWSRP
jgi:hypothetical protein